MRVHAREGVEGRPLFRRDSGALFKRPVRDEKGKK